MLLAQSEPAIRQKTKCLSLDLLEQTASAPTFHWRNILKTCWRAALTGPAWEACSDQRGTTVCPVLTATSARLRRCSCIEHEENIFGILHRVNERRVGLPSQTSELDIPFARCARNLIRAAEARKHRSYRLFKGIRTPAMRRFIRPRLGLVWVVGCRPIS